MAASKKTIEEMTKVVVDWSRERGIHLNHAIKLMKRLEQVPGSRSVKETISALRTGLEKIAS